MVGRSVALGRHPWRYFVYRGVMLMLVGAGIDVVVWQGVPFRGIDILYLIGAVTPVCAILARGPSVVLVGSAIVVMASSPVLVATYGYHPFPAPIGLGAEASADLPTRASALHQWLIDGWFPLCPWAGFMMMGTWLARWRGPGGAGGGSFRATWPLVASGALAVIGAMTWWLDPGAMYVREGYCELFYPPSPGFVVAALGAFGLVGAGVDGRRTWLPLEPLRLVGRASLFVYVLQAAVWGMVAIPLARNERVPDPEWFVVAVMLVYLTFPTRRYPTVPSAQPRASLTVGAG